MACTYILTMGEGRHQGRPGQVQCVHAASASILPLARLHLKLWCILQAQHKVHGTNGVVALPCSFCNTPLISAAVLACTPHGAPALAHSCLREVSQRAACSSWPMGHFSSISFAWRERGRGLAGHSPAGPPEDVPPVLDANSRPFPVVGCTSLYVFMLSACWLVGFGGASVLLLTLQQARTTGVASCCLQRPSSIPVLVWP